MCDPAARLGSPMLRLFIFTAALLLPFAAVAQQPPPKPAEIAKLVEQLGSEDFAEREAAAKRLEELGTAAIEELRAGLKSENAETVRRASDLLRKAERDIANEKTLTPTLVELDVKDKPLDAVLADISKQAKCDVVLGGLMPDDLAVKKVTVNTGGKVPFWQAVLKVCDAADLQVASVAGFVAPGATPYLGRPKAGVRGATDNRRAVVLEARGDAKRRPGSVHGAVLVEAIPFPKNTVPGQPSALLQAWPEPRLQWEGATGTRVAKATDAAGARLASEFVPPDSPDVRRTSDGMILVRHADGTASFMRDTGGAFQLPGGFKPNTHQAVVRFKSGEMAPTAAKELTVSIYASVRTGIEPICQIRGLEINKPTNATGPHGTTISVTYSSDGGRGFTAKFEIGYDPQSVQLVGVGEDLPGVKVGSAGLGNQTVYGTRITDSAGKPYILGLSSGLTRRDPTSKRTGLILELALDAAKADIGPPDAITLWGTYLKPVEVAVHLKDVPLVGGK
jgi:hypothetical protein